MSIILSTISSNRVGLFISVTSPLIPTISFVKYKKVNSSLDGEIEKEVRGKNGTGAVLERGKRNAGRNEEKRGEDIYSRLSSAQLSAVFKMLFLFPPNLHSRFLILLILSRSLSAFLCTRPTNWEDKKRSELTDKQQKIKSYIPLFFATQLDFFYWENIPSLLCICSNKNNQDN